MKLFDNTATIKHLAATCTIPEITKGHEQLTHEIGSTVKSNGLGAYKAGCPITITERWLQHGYAYYRDEFGVVHRSKDIS